MSRTSLAIMIMAEQLRSAKQQVPEGAFYRHNASGNVYEVVGHAMGEANAEVLILYKAARHSDESCDSNDERLVFPWAREFHAFTGMVEDYDKGLGEVVERPRFTRVRWQKGWAEA